MGTQAVIIERCSGHKTRYDTVLVPSNDDLIEAALGLRQAGGDTRPAAGQYGNCLGVYIPPREYHLQDVDPFGGARGDTRKGGTISAACAFWLGSEVRVAEAMYEREPIEICYYCKRTNGVQVELFDGASQEDMTEGAMRIVEHVEYERNPWLRKSCLEHQGCHCVICGLSFHEVYGACAQGLIHVHHLRPLSQVGTAHAVDPKKDLVPVCPNCHAVIHLKDPPYGPGEVQEMLKGGY